MLSDIIIYAMFSLLFYSWRTPTSVKHRSFRNLRSSMDSPSQPISPLVYSSPSSSVRHNHSLSTSSPVSNHAAITTTPNRQHNTTPGRYFDFRPANSPQTRGVMVGYRSSGTTPQRSGPQMQSCSVSHFRAPL